MKDLLATYIRLARQEENRGKVLVVAEVDDAIKIVHSGPVSAATVAEGERRAVEEGISLDDLAILHIPKAETFLNENGPPG